MKRSILLLFLAIASVSTAIAQQEKPKKEFLLTLSETTIQLKPGETHDVVINLVRSKAFSKSKAKLGLSSSLPEGLSLSYEPSEGMIETSTIRISASGSAKPGTYTLLPKCIMNNTSKGTMLKVIVGDGGQGASGK